MATNVGEHEIIGLAPLGPKLGEPLGPWVCPFSRQVKQVRIRREQEREQ